VLLLLWVEVAGGHVAAWRQEEVEGEELSARLGGAGANDDPLPAQRVVDDNHR
jgi:hypothetical protein